MRGKRLIPSKTNRSSDFECSGSSITRARSSSKAVAASSKETLCLVRLEAALRGSHSNSILGIHILYVQQKFSQMGDADSDLGPYQSWHHSKALLSTVHTGHRGDRSWHLGAFPKCLGKNPRFHLRELDREIFLRKNFHHHFAKCPSSGVSTESREIHYYPCHVAN